MIKFLSKTNLKKYRGKTALVRIDLNVEPGASLDSYRLEAIVPTIILLLKHRMKVVILSHRGRPKVGNYASGIKNHKFSLKPFARIISKKLKQPVVFFSALRFQSIEKEINNSRERVFLLENLRFFRGEESNDPTFARELAKLGDCYVNDAFAVSHRKHASVVAITNYLPSYGGLRLEKEMQNLDTAMKRSRHPLTVIIGGAKISDKIGVLEYFKKKADHFLLAGGPANTFFLALGMPVGDSLVEAAAVPTVRRFLGNRKVILPSDVKMGGRKILDIGARTIGEWSEIIKKSRTVIWNGPPGFYEKPGFEKGTIALWNAMLSKNQKPQTRNYIVGGGETVASLRLLTKNQKLLTKNKNLFISTGGGAMLEYLSGKKLPGIEALK